MWVLRTCWCLLVVVVGKVARREMGQMLGFRAGREVARACDRGVVDEGKPPAPMVDLMRETGWYCAELKLPIPSPFVKI